MTGPTTTRAVVRSLDEAVRLIPAGAAIAIAGPAHERRPLALVRELARQGKRPARLLARTAGPEEELLGIPLEIVPSVRPPEVDVVLLHADAASVSGDVLLVDDPDTWYADRELSRSARVIASVEQLVSADTVAVRPRDLLVRGEGVLAVVHAPFGAHPLRYPGRYPADPGARATGPEAADHWAYLDAVGFARLLRRATIPDRERAQ